MDIYITGASGYIGNAVAKACARKGHTVFGLARTEEKGRELQKEEITPLVCNIENFAKAAKGADAIIHCALESPEKEKTNIQWLIDARADAFIYTSGIWVYGNREEPVHEESALHPIQLASWRPGIEDMVLNCDAKSVVIRPGCVYGYARGLFAKMFQGAAQGKIEIAGSGQNHWPVVHVDDLAELYLLALEHGLIQTVLNGTENSSLQIKPFAEKLATLTNSQIDYLEPEQALKKFGPLQEGLSVNQIRVSNEKAKRLLGWIPRHNDLFTRLDHYWMSWEASSK